MNLRTLLCAIGVLVAVMPNRLHAEGDAGGGAKFYRACAACHSLEPDVHLTGPSLADLWGKPAASLASYDRYSEALEGLDIVWDETTLNAWIADPSSMAPGTYMIFRGIEDETAREDLVAFLKIALKRETAKAAVASGLIPDNLAQGQIPENLSDVDASRRITAMRHCRSTYSITTADGHEQPYWETNVRLKTDASGRGPGSDPVLVSSGMMGDRVSVVFSNVEAIGNFVTTNCR